MNKIEFAEITNEREIAVRNEHVTAFEKSAAGRLWRDNNRVAWSMGHGNDIGRVDKMNDDIVAKQPCNEASFKQRNDDDPDLLIESIFTVTIDATVTVDGTKQRIIRRVGSVGFTPKNDKGKYTPYLITGSGKLTITATGNEYQNILRDVVGFVIKAHKKAEIHDATHFWNNPIVRNAVKPPVFGQPMELPSL